MKGKKRQRGESKKERQRRRKEGGGRRKERRRGGVGRSERKGKRDKVVRGRKWGRGRNR